MGPYLAQPNQTKISFAEENNQASLRYTRIQMQGWRRMMQDAAITSFNISNGASIFAVFDGHGGPEVSTLVSRIFILQLKSCKYFNQLKYQQALIETFKKIDQIISSRQGQAELRAIRKNTDYSYSDNSVSMSAGCTACVVLVTPTRIITANAGDSRATLCRKGIAIPLSYDHKPQNNEQKKRIQAGGGLIINGRINGGLNLSRGFGDFNFKTQKNLPYDQQLLICKPDVTSITRQPNQDQYIIMGCDGIWERYDCQGMIDRITHARKKERDEKKVLSDLMDELLAKDTSQQYGCDNMTAILIDFI